MNKTDRKERLNRAAWNEQVRGVEEANHLAEKTDGTENMEEGTSMQSSAALHRRTCCNGRFEVPQHTLKTKA